MNPIRNFVSLSFRLSLLPVLFAAANLGRTQTSNPKEEEVVKLPEFRVDASKDTGYVGSNSLGASRAAIPVVDMPVSVVVLTRELINDTASYQLSDVTRLVSGMSDSAIPNQDILGIMLRGFNPKLSTDGFVSGVEGAEDLADVARVEVFKGPSSILLTQGGSSGGVINRITKSPLETPQGYLKVETGQYNSDRVEADSTGPVPGTSGKLLYRLILMDQDGKGYAENEYEKESMVAPSFTYLFTKDSYITFKYNRFFSKTTQDVGQPEDTSDLSILKIYPVPRTRTDNDPNDMQNLHRNRYDLTYGLKVTDYYRFAFGADYADITYWRQNTRPSGAGTASSPLVLPDGTVPRKWERFMEYLRDSRIYFDNVVRYAKGSVDNTAIIGAEGLQYRQDKADSGFLAMPSTNIYFPTVAVALPKYYAPLIPTSDQRNGQAYVLDMLKAFNDRLLLSGGVTRHWFETGSWNTTLNGFSYKTGVTDTSQYGVIVRPVKGVSLYYSFNENFNPQFTELGVVQSNGTVTDIGVAPPQMTKSREAGVKFLLLDNRLSATVDYFEMSLTNRTQYIFGTTPSLYTLVGGGTSRGWEADVFYNPTPNWSWIGSGATMRAVDNSGLPLAYSAKQTVALLSRYDFRGGLLKGLGLSLAANYEGRRPIYFNSSASLANELWMGGRTLVNAAAYYSWGKHYKVQVNVDNVFDKWYLAGGYLPTRVYFGDGRNVKASLTYSF
jgi:iron complex outermembrane receptor protein